MYPQAELTILERRKQTLLMRIAIRRVICETQVKTLAHSLRWIGTVRRFWNAVSPVAKLAAFPAGLLLARRVSPGLGRWLHWAPAAVRVYRAFCR